MASVPRRSAEERTLQSAEEGGERPEHGVRGCIRFAGAELTLDYSERRSPVAIAEPPLTLSTHARFEGMSGTILIPPKRLRMIPREQRLAHEYSFFLHDQCAKLLVEHEQAETHVVKLTFVNDEEHSKFENLARASNPIDALRAIGRENEAKRVVLNSVTKGLVSDYLHHIFEALRCLERRKFVVALNLLRKPLVDSLLYLSWLLADEEGFYTTFTSRSPEDLTSTKLGNRRLEILKAALLSTSLAQVFEAAEIESVVYDKSNRAGLYWLMQRAVHLITTMHEAIKTEPENFNFIFKRYTDDDVYVGLYASLPLILLYTSHVIAELFDRIQPMDRGAKSAFNARTMAGFTLVKAGPGTAIVESILPQFAEGLTCSSCGTPPKFTRHNAVRAILSDTVRCAKCGRVSAFPLSWIL